MINERVEKDEPCGRTRSASSGQLLALAALDLADELKSAQAKLQQVERLTRSTIANAIARIDSHAERDEARTHDATRVSDEAEQLLRARAKPSCGADALAASRAACRDMCGPFAAICERLCALPEFERGATIVGYAAFRKEADPACVLNRRRRRARRSAWCGWAGTARSARTGIRR